MENLLQELRRTLPERINTVEGRLFLPNSPYVAGVETRTKADQYFWDSQKRGGDPACPFVVYQTTLAGAGIYEDASGRHRIEPGRAFAAVIPGENRYYLPEAASGSDAAPSWTFFYLLIRHPYVVERIVARQRMSGTALLDVTENSVVTARAVALLFGGFADPWAEEEALLQFAIAYDRHVAHAGPDSTSENDSKRLEASRLLETARRFVIERLDRPADVAELAAAQGMSRSRFSHYFRDTTGQSPARFMAHLRLEEVSRRLVQTGDSLERIAALTGFTDANHLCKAFRRHFRISPGAFRRQVR